MNLLLLRRGKWLGYCSNDVPTVTELFSSADDDFIHSVKTNSTHVLQSYLPDWAVILYRLRTRPHNMTMINKTKLLNDINSSPSNNSYFISICHMVLLA